MQAVFATVAVNLERKKRNKNVSINRTYSGRCALKFFPKLKHKVILKSFWFIEICADWVDIT